MAERANDKVKRTLAKKTAKKAGAKKPSMEPGATTAKGESLHCYRLIFQVDPGGSRKAESFVAGTLDEARRAALTDLQSGEGAYHALFYGEEIVLECWQGPRKVATVNLHPFITYRIDGMDDPIVLPEGNDAVLSMDDEALMMKVLDGKAGIKVEIDWASIPLPELTGRPVRPGESVTLENGISWPHGFHSHWDEKIDL